MDTATNKSESDYVVSPITGKPVVDPSRQFGRGALRKVIADVKSKCEVILKDFAIPHLTQVSLWFRKKSYINSDFRISFFDEIRTNVRTHFINLVEKDPYTFRQIDEAIQTVEQLYSSYLANFGIKDDLDIGRIRGNTSPSEIGLVIASNRLAILDTIHNETKIQVTNFLNSVERLITEEANRLNSTDPYVKRARRILSLENFANGKVQELINIREDYKRRIQEAYARTINEQIKRNQGDEELRFTSNL